MKRKITPTKAMAITLCVVIMGLSWNIYSSFKNVYFLHDILENPIGKHTIAVEKNSLFLMDTQIPGQNLKNTEARYNTHKGLFLRFLFLFLSFISLGGLHNWVLEIGKGEDLSSKSRKKVTNQGNFPSHLKGGPASKVSIR